MTRKQQEFYRIVVNQMVDFNEDFHKEFIIKRIEKIPDDQLKYLLEHINLDKDKIIKKKGYITYVKFSYYADKIIETTLKTLENHSLSKTDSLYQKREQLLHIIENNTQSIAERNKLIDSIKEKKTVFQINNQNFLDSIDYFIIDKFGFYNFFDPNRNYMIKEEIEKYHKEYILSLPQNNTKQLTK